MYHVANKETMGGLSSRVCIKISEAEESHVKVLRVYLHIR